MLAVAGLTMVAPAAPASATNITSCDSADLAWIVVDGGLRVCLANPGNLEVGVRRGTSFHSGNNRVTFYCTVEENDASIALAMDKRQDRELSFGMHADVHMVTIH